MRGFLRRQVAPTDESWLAIIDHSIDIGTKKALVVLRVSTKALSARGGAISLEDCACVGLTISDKITGETVAADLGGAQRLGNRMGSGGLDLRW